MNKKLAAALSGGAVLVLALTGCSDDNEELDSWAKEVCDGVQPQAKKIREANAAIQKQTADNSSPKAVQKADSKAFQDMSDAYKSIGSTVDKAGAPPVDGGEGRQQDAVKELNSISKSYADLKTRVDKLDTGDQSKFADGLNGVAKELDKLSKSGNDALQKLEEGDVGKAMSEQESCKRAPAPTAT